MPVAGWSNYGQPCLVEVEPAAQRKLATGYARPRRVIMPRIVVLAVLAAGCLAQGIFVPAFSQSQPASNQLNVNWLYGSYIPKNVPRETLNGHQRAVLYVRQTYTTPGIYVKTLLFTLHDQTTDSYPQWGDGFGGFAKRLGNRQAQFIIQNSFTSLGNGLLGWEPRYDRCTCEAFWPRTRHAVARNFVTYDRTEKSLRPQLMPYLGAFGSAALATEWEPGNSRWTVKGYQAAVTQVFVGAGINWIGEFSPEITRILKRKKRGS
jgi:hypothetical protein